MTSTYQGPVVPVDVGFERKRLNNLVTRNYSKFDSLDNFSSGECYHDVICITEKHADS